MSGTKSGFYTVTPKNVGYLNNLMAAGNSMWKQANKSDSNRDTYSNAYNGSFYTYDNTGNGGGGTDDTPTGGTTTGSSGSGYSMYDYLNSLYGSYAANKQAQLQAAYDSARDRINSGYESALGRIADTLDQTKGAINSSYQNSLKSLNTDANKSLREAYVNNAISQKNLGQQLSAMGLSGGASESTIAKMNNEYGNASNDIRTTLNTNIGNLNTSRDQSLADAYATYNSNAASLEQNRASQLASIEQALASGLADALDQQFSFQTSSNYLSALQDALNNMNSYTATPTAANNTVQSVNTQQTTPDALSQTTNSQEYLDYLMRLLGYTS